MKIKEKLVSLIVVMSVMLAACSSDDNTVINEEPIIDDTSRDYFLGFTPFPYDITSSAVDDVYAKIANDADLITHHFDGGIPWNDALVGNYPYDNNIMNNWGDRISKSPGSHKVYVAVTPIGPARDSLALLKDTDNDMPLLPPFDAHALNGDFNHPEIKTAYLNYCARVIDYFAPDYFAIGIEVNGLRKNTDAQTWAKYKELNDDTYASLKVLYPDLPIFTTVSPDTAIEGYALGLPDEFVGNPTAFAASQQSAIQDVLSSSDYYAISLYPYTTAFYDTPYPDDFLTTIFALSDKPIAIAETGMIAQNINAFSTDFIGSLSLQNKYVEDLFAASDDANVEFISWFILQDYDDLCTTFGGCPDPIVMWRDTGLYDGTGMQRPAYATWKQKLAVNTP